MSTVDKDIVLSICANCGKESSNDNMNTCNKCKMVKYCNAACKKKHRSKHKKACERRVAELHDKELFKQAPSQYGDCPICFTRIPLLKMGWRYYPCCGKTVCSGCIHAPVYDNQGNIVTDKKCPFCRTPIPSTYKEAMEREKERVEAGDANAIFNRGNYYREGRYGFPQDYTKALELYHRAAELGNAEAYRSIGIAYERGDGVEDDMKKAMQYYDLSAIGGCVGARHNLGLVEYKTGNKERALKHFMIAVRGGQAKSLETIKALYSNGFATKDVYTKALQAYQAYLSEIKSPQRDKAAADREDYRYY